MKNKQPKPYSIIVDCIDGWYSAICSEFMVSGFGNNREDAIKCCLASIRSVLLVHAKLIEDDDFGRIVDIK